MYRFHPRTRALIRHVRSGAIGELRGIQTAFAFRLNRSDNIRLDPELGGGALMDVGCYCVNVSRTLVGSEPLTVRATARWTDRGVDDEMAGTLHFENGVVAQMSCALTQTRRETVEVAGTDAWLRVPSAFLPGKGQVDFEVHGDDGRAHSFDGTDQYLAMVDHFNRCVISGEPPRYSALEAARNMATIDALYASARRGGDAVVVQPPAAE